MTTVFSSPPTMHATDRLLTIVNPKTLHNPAPLGYSTAVLAPENGRTAYISGQGGQDHTGALSTDFEDQVEQAYANLLTSLEGVGAKPEHVAKLTVLVVDHDMSKLDILTRHVKRVFGDTLPAQTRMPVPKLAVDGMLFEVEAIAVVR